MAYLPEGLRCAVKASLFAAVYVEYMGKPEECREMECARSLAAWMAEQPNGTEELLAYQKLSPEIVKAIRAMPGYEVALDMLHVTYAAPCVEAVEEGRMTDAFAVYRRMMEAVTAQWLPDQT